MHLPVLLRVQGGGCTGPEKMERGPSPVPFPAELGAGSHRDADAAQIMCTYSTRLSAV